MTKFVTKRIYQPAEAADGYRVLVDRLWPRGISKSEARLDAWCKDIAPSDTLRKWFNHDPAKYPEFSRRYQRELEANDELDAVVASWRNHSTVTLLYSTRDETHNQALVLQEFLRR